MIMRYSHLIALSILAVPTWGQLSCTLCPNGDDALFPTLIIPELGVPGPPHPTCQDVASYATRTQSQDVCDTIQAQAAYCGCFNAEAPASDTACSLCDNAANAINADISTKFGGMACSELEEYLTFLPADVCASDRGQLLSRQAHFCGCPNSQPICAMCPDGTNNLQNPNKVVPFFNLDAANENPTCQQVADAAAFSDPEQVDCAIVKQQAGYCGCVGVSPPQKCSFCPNGAQPVNMGKVAPTSDTCEDLYDYVQFMGDIECNSRRFQSIQGLGFTCGCPGVEASCSLCPDGSGPIVPEKEAQDSGETCLEMFGIIAAYTEDVCDDAETTVAVSAARCCAGPPEFPICAIQQNPQLCTHQLLDTVKDTEDCECYAFCDGAFQMCHGHPGGLLLSQLCAGVPVSGCNRASALGIRVQ